MHQQEKIDWLGALLLISALSLFTYIIIHASSVGFYSIEFIGGIGLVLILAMFFYLHEQRSKKPLLNFVDLKKPKILLGFTICASAGIGTTGMMFLIPLYLSTILNIPALHIGYILLAVPIMQIVLSLFWDRLINAFNISAVLLFCISTALLSALLQVFFGLNTPVIYIIAVIALLGFIWGAGNMGAVTLAAAAVPVERVGTTIGTIFTGWNAMGSVALALASTVFTYSSITE